MKEKIPESKKDNECSIMMSKDKIWRNERIKWIFFSSFFLSEAPASDVLLGIACGVRKPALDI